MTHSNVSSRLPSRTALQTTIALFAAETMKLVSSRATWILVLVTILGTWPMALSNASSGVDLPADDPLLFSSEPIPLEFQGFEMAGFGYVLVVAISALWAGSEYGSGGQLRTTLLATPRRLRVFIVKVALLTVLVAATAFLTMWGTIAITHSAGQTSVDPWTLNEAIWSNLAGVTVAWVLTAVITFAIGTLARSAILPLILITPLVIGIGDFLAGLWDGARFLPITAGAAMHSDPASGTVLEPLTGGLVQAGWAASLLIAAAISFTRRDL
ncbi:ABC transporter permease [Microbacterium sp. WCS2018Hpa-23]|uniref:ABC transporter permease n=1 Tax=Microbacterium sp. WCS2018Hpa-23 TaxID=3073634 RepID=UPI002882F6A6|nr:ABC transporter permease [Microbacterium sp. WCS2018Hpa-23]